jgi:hypothetical protein
MKKLTIFLISLMLLTFNNNASASFFGDIFKDLFGDTWKPNDFLENSNSVNNVRCKIEYTQLDLATGLEKNVKYTAQYSVDDIAKGTDVLYLLSQDLTDKINIWLNESENNVISDMTIINCKERKFNVNQLAVWKSKMSWGEYKGCADEFNVRLVDWLEHHNQWGFNVHKERLIKDYEDGCVNYSREF